MKTTLYLLTGLLLVLAELLYLKIAAHFNIVDHPNHRSSHHISTITGGGIIFIIAMACYTLFFKTNYPYFMAGLFLAGTVSFIDDIKPLNYQIRICCQALAMTLLFYQLSYFGLPLYLITLAFFIAIGTINAINFMDGINGMTGGYALVTLGSLLYINEFIVTHYVDSSLIIIAMLAVIIFNYFNFRTRARCFAGDVGSISKAFILIFLIGKLVMVSGNLAYVLLLFVYGLDSVTTIAFRLLRRENIFEAHRSHYFQYLVHVRKIPHLLVSTAYSAMQLIFNAIIIIGLLQSWVALLLFASAATYIFIILRFWMEGKERLLYSSA